VVTGSNNANAPARTVALAVTPRQAAMVALIHAVGTEYLSLRPADDAADPVTSPVSTDDLQPNPPAVPRPAAAAAAAPAPQPRARTRTIEVIAGKSDNVSRVNLAEGR
jgi:Flp pilus assembly protein CpaB